MRRASLIATAVVLAAGVGAVPAEAAKTPVSKVLLFDLESGNTDEEISEGETAIVYVDRTYLKGSVSVDVVLVSGDGTAEADDVSFTSGTSTVKNGTRFGWVFIPTAEDTLVEDPETFTLALVNPSNGYTVGPPLTVTIIDDDSAPS